MIEVAAKLAPVPVLVLVIAIEGPAETFRLVGDNLLYIVTVAGAAGYAWRKALRPIIHAAHATLAATRDLKDLKDRVTSMERRFERILVLVDVIATDEADDIRAAVRRALAKS